jgi:hypothetical protein
MALYILFNLAILVILGLVVRFFSKASPRRGESCSTTRLEIS